MNNDKTTPSQDVRLAWLAGILDGEGTIGHYTTKAGALIFNVAIVNTDLRILDEVSSIYEELGIPHSTHLKNSVSESSFKPRKPCYYLYVRQRGEMRRLLELVVPYLRGEKQQRAMECIEFIDKHPIKEKPVYEYTCVVCNKVFSPGRKRNPEPRFCSVPCWHIYAVGKDNPNYRHGKRTSGVTTE